MAGTLSLVYVIQKDRWLPLRVVGLLAGLGFMLHVGQEQFPGFQALFFSIWLDVCAEHLRKYTGRFIITQTFYFGSSLRDGSSFST